MLISATPSNFAFLSRHQSSSRLVPVFLGTLYSSIKKTEAPYLSDLERWIALHQCRESKPHLPARGMCQVISRVTVGSWGIFSSYRGDGHSKLHFVQGSQDSCFVMTDTSGI